MLYSALSYSFIFIQHVFFFLSISATFIYSSLNCECRHYNYIIQQNDASLSLLVLMVDACSVYMLVFRQAQTHRLVCEM